MDAKTLIDNLLSSGLTQMEIERRAGVDQATVSHIHTGRRGKRPSYELMSKLQTLWEEVSVESAK